MHSYINASLQALAIPIDSVMPDPENERVHDERNMAAIRASIARFGQHQVITVWKEHNIIVAGNARWKAMKDLGYTHIAANIKSMSKIEAVALRVADNRTAELASWKGELLQKTVDALKAEGEDPAAYGFNDADMASILSQQYLWEPTTIEKKEGDEPEEDKAERIVVSITDMTLRAPIRNAVLELVKKNGWEDEVEVL